MASLISAISPNNGPALGSAMRANWSFDDLLTSDGHRLRAVFSCSLLPLDQPAERKFFEETFLIGSTAVSIDQIVAHFKPALQSMAARLAAKGAAHAAMEQTDKSNWIEALKTAGKGIAFSCGIELLPPFSVEISSPSLEREQHDQMQRAVAQRTTAQRMEHFRHAADLLQKWESLKNSLPTISPGRLLEQLNPTDRGPMLQTLLMASAQRVRQPDLWAVSGNSIVCIGFGAEASDPQLIALPVTAGPVRSVQLVDGQILAGAQRGVIVLAMNNLAQSEVYLDPELNSEHGFTHATADADSIIACHRDGGIVRWQQGSHERPTAAVRAGELQGSPKYLTRIGSCSQLIFAVGERLLKLTSGMKTADISTFSSPIVSLLSTVDQVIVVTENGGVTFLDGLSFAKISSENVPGPITAAALLPWLNTSRILLTAAQGLVQCIGLEDQTVTQYSSAHLGIRNAIGSPGKIGAMSADRQRVIFWNTWDSRTPVGEIHLTSLTRHRIADIAFG